MKSRLTYAMIYVAWFLFAVLITDAIRIKVSLDNPTYYGELLAYQENDDKIVGMIKDFDSDRVIPVYVSETDLYMKDVVTYDHFNPTDSNKSMTLSVYENQLESDYMIQYLLSSTLNNLGIFTLIVICFYIVPLILLNTV